MQEELLQKGGNVDSHDGRDFLLSRYLKIKEGALGSTPFNWDEGYDVEKDLSFKLPLKDQKQSLSCVGQSSSYYKQLYEFYLKRVSKEKSAKSIYSQIFLPYGGAYLRDAMLLMRDTYGINTEEDVPSYEYGDETSEKFMRDKSWMNETLTSKAKYFMNSDAYRVDLFGMDDFAKAIQTGKGCLMGIIGCNNGTWYSKFPKPPTDNTPQNQLWSHAIVGVAAVKIDGKNYIKIKQAWGPKVGDQGYQYLGGEWFTEDGKWIFNPWVFCPKIMFKQENLKHATAYTIFIKKQLEDGTSKRFQRQGFCINKNNENKLIIASESIVTKLREDISQKEYKDSKGQSFWAFSTPKITIEISDSDYNNLKKYDQNWNTLEDTI